MLNSYFFNHLTKALRLSFCIDMMYANDFLLCWFYERSYSIYCSNQSAHYLFSVFNRHNFFYLLKRTIEINLKSALIFNIQDYICSSYLASHISYRFVSGPFSEAPNSYCCVSKTSATSTLGNDSIGLQQLRVVGLLGSDMALYRGPWFRLWVRLRRHHGEYSMTTATASVLDLLHRNKAITTRFVL